MAGGTETRVAGRRWLRTPLLLSLLGLAACAADPYVAIADWMLRTPDGTTREIHAPRRLDDILPGHPTTYVLAADVPLPRALRAQPLTLTWADTDAFATLHVGREAILPLSVAPFDRVRPSQRELVFRIPETETDRAMLHLELRVHHVDVWTMRIGAALRLAAAPYGERQARVARHVNGMLATGMAAIFCLLALASGVWFVLDRRRAADGWFALMTLGVAASHLCLLGVTQLVDARDLMRVLMIMLPLNCVSAIRFTQAYFRLSPARVVPLAVIALGVAEIILDWKPFASYQRHLVLDTSIIGLTILDLLVMLGRLAWRPARRFEALCMLGAWVLIATSALIADLDPGMLCDPRPVANLILMVTLAVLLLRQHARDLRALNLALEDRVTALEERSREVSRLNDELRRQIHDRSARFADALGHLGRLASRTSKPLIAGTLVGDGYKVVRSLGRGGMGAVYEVERTTDGRRLALKALLHADSGARLARLAREAQAATAIAHPNVVGIVDIDVDASGMPFIVMELIEGHALSTRRDQFGDAALAREVMRQVAAGLAALHRAGIVHRDLKPANVLLQRQADNRFCAKIVDFGIARVVTEFHGDRALAAPSGVLDTSGFIPFVCSATETAWSSGGGLTRTGWLLGTPLYMAPELARGVKDAQPPCDVWSLGVLGYQVGCGKLPFTQPLVTRIGDGPCHPPCLDTQGLPEPLRGIVARCLDVDPLRRPTADEVAAALA